MFPQFAVPRNGWNLWSKILRAQLNRTVDALHKKDIAPRYDGTTSAGSFLMKKTLAVATYLPDSFTHTCHLLQTCDRRRTHTQYLPQVAYRSSHLLGSRSPFSFLLHSPVIGIMYTGHIQNVQLTTWTRYFYSAASKYIELPTFNTMTAKRYAPTIANTTSSYRFFGTDSEKGLTHIEKKLIFPILFN